MICFVPATLRHLGVVLGISHRRRRRRRRSLRDSSAWENRAREEELDRAADIDAYNRVICSFFNHLIIYFKKQLNTSCRIQSGRQATLHVKKVAAKREKGREGSRVQERKIGESAFNGSQVARPSVRPPCVHVRPPSRCLCSLRRRRGRAARSVIVIKGALLSSA